MIEQIINAGFLRNKILGEPNKQGWYGCSKTVPDNIFIKGNKKIFFSLNGMFTTHIIPQNFITENWEMFSTGSTRLIVLLNGEVFDYISITGTEPSNEILTDFLNAA